ncbi:FAD-binding oxidoreductase [Dyella sp. M7H15-1]|uniref:BBE domain-containing protein n=1 Tax=Dyella sp. M7H15-1 TaxID=2501295 RepID=UPI0010050E3D|nr:BBE domain-containing protein [Dyella sp. M7H15-1]QAU23237.1 FAD-binding oxidoreductase [Dyella sp. M7H15-1]
MAYVKIGNTDPRHTTLQKGFNLRWPIGNVEGESSPNGASFIYICRTETDIVEAAADALSTPVGRINVRSGGHCYEGFVSNRMPGNFGEVLSILDIGLMTGMDYNENGVQSPIFGNLPLRYKFRVAAGNQNWDGYAALYKETGKTIPGGSCYSVGAGGHICGGGYGFLSRMHGLTCDWLAGVDMLVPDSQGAGLRPIHVSRESLVQRERDLFAACCGAGGGQFGIITSYYFKDLPEAPREILWLPLEFHLPSKTTLASLLRAYYQWFHAHQSTPETWGLATKLELRHFNSGPHTLGIHYVDRNGGVSDRTYFNDFVSTMLQHIPEARVSLTPPEVYHIPSGQALSGRRVANVDEALDATRRMDWLPFTQLVNGSGPNQRGRYKSAYQKGNFTDTVIDGIWGALNSSDPDNYQTQSLLQIQSYGGQINEASDETRRESSVAQRSSLLKWQPQTYWTEPDKLTDDEHAKWIRGLYVSAFADSDGIPVDDNFEGCYLNYPDLDMTYSGGLPENGKNPDWRYIYFPDAHIEARLRNTKAHWDPRDLFRNEMSVPLNAPVRANLANA